MIIAGGVLGSFSLLAHLRVIGAQSTAPPVNVVRGGTWTDDTLDPDSLIPNGGSDGGGMD